ncbi:MAG TPA: FHA domain-containing protein [Pyrinomonadaceae bacterium]|jgi:hypothetical protein|nr:FHA domain-containing protein [Pyrinomonadaceae bacterium]
MSLKVLITAPHGSPDETRHASILGEHSLNNEITIIGSDPQTASLCLPDRKVAAEHVIVIREEIAPDDEQAVQYTLINRAPGTCFNDERLEREARRELFHGDQLLLGSYVLTFTFTAYALPPQQQQPAIPTEKTPAETPETPPIPIPPPPAETAPDVRAATTLEPASSGSFESILNNLRTEEDSYHFRIVGGSDNGRRVVLNQTEIPLGWEEDGLTVAFSTARVATPRAVVRKEWSGINIEVLAPPPAVSINGQAIEGVYRLRNGDQVALHPPPPAAAAANQENRVVLSFHEPASLVALSAMLPPPVGLERQAQLNGGQPSARAERDFNTPIVAGTAALGLARLIASRRKMLGYYPLEWLIMTIGTLLAAVIIFLVLEITS